MLSFLLALLNVLSKILDQLSYVEGLNKEKKSPESQYNESIKNLHKALFDHNASSLAALSEQLRPDKNSSDTGIKGTGPAP